MSQEPDDMQEYERTCDEIELALMNATVDTSDKVSALVEVMCRMLAGAEYVPDQRFFSRLSQFAPGRVATIIMESAGVE